MDWYEEGRKWVDRWWRGDAYASYGRYTTTHLRALLRLTNNSEEWLAALDGFNARMREICNMPFNDLEKI